MLLRPRKFNVRLWMARLALLGVATGAASLLLEGAVRVLLPHYRPRAQITFTVEPDGLALGPLDVTVRLANSKGDFDTSVTFNQLGLRDRKDLRTAKTGALFALGDSFTMGWGVTEEERYGNQLERRLGEPIYNVAIPTDLRGYQRLLGYAESQGEQVSRLILGVCMENDLRDYRREPAYSTSPVTPTHTLQRPWHTRARHWLRTHSALFIATCHELQKFMVMRRWLERAGLARDGEHTTHHNVFDETMLLSCRDEVLRLAKGREITVLLIPSRGLWLGANQETERRVHTRFGELLRAAGLRVVDPISRFERDGPPLNYYFKADPHWNTRGHRVASEELAAALGGSSGH